MEGCACCLHINYEVPHQEGRHIDAADNDMLDIRRGLVSVSLLTLIQVDIALAAGLHSVTWSSLNIQAFFRKVSFALQEFQTFNKQVSM